MRLWALTCIFPADYKAAFVERLATDANELARQAAVGFLLDRDDSVALAAVRGLVGASGRGQLDERLRRRIGMVRAWLQPVRQSAIDDAVGGARPMAPRAAANVAWAKASVCDGSGGAMLTATLKHGARYSIASIMMKPSGVADAVLMEDLPKSDVKDYERTMALMTPTYEVLPATFARLLQLALGRHAAHGEPPPFALVPIMESLGFDTLLPDPSTPAEMINSALAGVPERDLPAALREAHHRATDSVVTDGWFEAGEAVDAILERCGSTEDGARALLKRYLPGRRAFWGSQCARSAIAMKDAATPGNQTWKQLALVGRDILGDVALGDIPLMRQIADRSAMAFFNRP